MAKEFVRRWGPAVLLMLVIFMLSSIPGEEFPVYRGAWDYVIKKSGHLVEYGLLAALMLRGVAGRAAARRGHYALALGLTILYAVSDEFHQSFTPGRNAQVADVAIDAIGACLGLAFYYGWRVIRQTRSQSPQSHSTRPGA